jgi:hypothetical protein
MDADHFDTFIRTLTAPGSRRGALAALLSGTLSTLTLASTDARKRKGRGKKKKKKKKKKGKDGTEPEPVEPVNPCPDKVLCNGECIASDQCCSKADCPATSAYRCCNGVCTDELIDAGDPCLESRECCSDYCVEHDRGRHECAATCRGKPCSPEGGCCRGFTCLATGGPPGRLRCGGCADADFEGFCNSDADCCFSACNVIPALPKKRCLSYTGGPCAKSTDCMSCALSVPSAPNPACRTTIGGRSQDICTNGVCGCPEASECCTSSDCPGQTCVLDGDGLSRCRA